MLPRPGAWVSGGEKPLANGHGAKVATTRAPDVCGADPLAKLLGEASVSSSLETCKNRLMKGS